MTRTTQPKSRPAFRPFDDAAIYKVDEETAERMTLTFRQLQRFVYNGEISYIQYPSGRRLRGCDLNDWVQARLRTPVEGSRFADPRAVERGRKSQRVQKARRAAKARRTATGA